MIFHHVLLEQNVVEHRQKMNASEFFVQSPVRAGASLCYRC
ncbi:hypothetical protein QWZ13_17990 [Reinekea marina]|nr:hypothetical protein [Reinekea marina]MDN3650801.1 hypothetical protein [Reinekea marina]